jgi:hypothetical protein
MADSDFEFDEFFDQMNSESGTSTTTDTRNTPNTSNTLYPFSVRLGKEYVKVIKALAWWKRISQRKFIENCLDYALEEMDKERLTTILNKYNEEQ